MAEKRLFLIDAYALIYRSYYAFINNPMRNAAGFNTSTIFGFINTIEEIIRVQKPTHLGVAFDLPTPTFRHEIFPEYKANRPPSPEDIRNSVPIIKQIIDYLNIARLELPGFEADDVVGTIAKKAEKEGFTVYMMTSDKDYGQLVSDNIFIFKPRKFGNDVEIVGVPEILKKYSIQDPMQVVDILALWGDAVDNVPGVPGVGEKTACKLVGEYGSVEHLLEKRDELKGKLKQSVDESIDKLALAKTLVTIKCDVPLEFNADSLLLKPYNEEALKAIFQELNFKTLINRFIKSEVVKAAPVVNKQYVQGSLFDMPAAPEAPLEHFEITNYSTINDVPHEYKVIDETNFDEFVNMYEKLNEFCFDTETTGLDPHSDFLVGISFSHETHKGYYLPVPSDFNKACELLNKLKPLFGNNKTMMIGHNIKFDILFLLRYGVEVKGLLFDTMIAHYLIEPEQGHKMDTLSENYLNYKPVAIEELIGKKGAGQKIMSQVPIEKIKEYASEDADVTYQLKQILEKEISSKSLDNLFYNIEIKLLKVLIKLEVDGVKIDCNALAEYAKTLREDIIAIESEIYKLANGEFNISSPKQLGTILFEKLQIEGNNKMTKTSQYSTSEETLQELTDKHPIINKILEYRSLTKLLSTYVEALPKLVNERTGRIHTSFNQTIAATGRLSSTNPNLQNIPIRDEKGREIRKSFVAPSDEFLVLSADYSQIELRIMAHMSDDESMKQAFMNNEDIHTATAAKIYGIPLADVSREQRSKAKTANFGIIYGISAFGLAQRLNIPRKEASELIEGYFKNFPGVKTYMNNCIAVAREKGYVETLMGRRRLLPDINSKNSMVRGMAERNAINSPIQGSAADIIKLAMINIQEKLDAGKYKSQMVIQVHDELLFYISINEVDSIKAIVKHEMENAIQLNVPLIVDMGVGKNWLEAH
jgi:DNA polymerase-1